MIGPEMIFYLHLLLLYSSAHFTLANLSNLQFPGDAILHTCYFLISHSLPDKFLCILHDAGQLLPSLRSLPDAPYPSHARLGPQHSVPTASFIPSS